MVNVAAAVLVAVVLVFAIVAPRGLPEVVAAAPAAVLALLLGIVSPSQAVAELIELAPTVAFLAVILVLAHLADAMGVFSWLGMQLARHSRGSPPRLLRLVFVAAAVTTAVLSLDATVVLLTPMILVTAEQLGAVARPHNYASVHLANSASTLLPVSNLTNLLAFAATGLSFLHFTALMALPWLVTIAVEFVVFRIFFAHDLKTTSPRPAAPPPAKAVPAPRWALTVLTVTMLGFGLSSFLGVAPAWIAALGVLALVIPALKDGRTTPRRVLYAADLWFCLFVFALGILVAGLISGPLGTWLSDLLPRDTTFVSLLTMALVAAVVANVVNNLPATLMFVAALGTTAPPGLILAMLLGVNLGPTLTYVGSLATLLWRRISARAGQSAELGTFTMLGLATTPLTLLASVTALWWVL